MAQLESNIFDCALIFEGGGMRTSYTAAVANALLAEGIYFDHVYGVSAGSSNTANYLSRDRERTWVSFTALAAEPEFGDWRTFLQHKGMFNAQWIYQEAGLPDGAIPFDFETFMANPAKMTICGIERDTGATRYWTKEDTPAIDDLMLRVRASSTLPIAMPPVKVDGKVCYDGGLGEGNGLLIPAAANDGFAKFFIVRTRPKGYRKPDRPARAILDFFWRYPHMREALLAWGPGYNSMCDLAEQLEEEGR
ncbi:MAG: patatin family protein, partial [Eggerthellaceae bacterium]|nr:patatin family protein [Eggerthellaceae bacterium]